MEIPNDLIHAAFFFVDIVGLSDPSMSTSTQTVKIKTLNKFIKESETLANSPAEKLIIMPTGDGMFIGFVDGLEQPLKLAMEVQDKITEYNRDKHGDSFELLEVRIGCHVGNVFLVEDVSGTQNVWGPGIILARRVMDLGDAGHILLTSEMAEDVIEINNEYEKIIFIIKNRLIVGSRLYVQDTINRHHLWCIALASYLSPQNAFGLIPHSWSL